MALGFLASLLLAALVVAARRRPAVLMAAVVTVGLAGLVAWALRYQPTAAPRAEASPSLEPPSPSDEGPDARQVEIPPDAEGFDLSLDGWGTLSQIGDGAGNVHRPPRGRVFLLVHVRFANRDPQPGVEVVISSRGAEVTAPDGGRYPASGGGEGGQACSRCTVEVATSDRQFVITFLFVVPRALDRPGEFEFRFRDAEPMPFQL
jgi:hypothetical protein